MPLISSLCPPTYSPPNPHLSRSITVIQAIHARLQRGYPAPCFWLGLRKRSCFFEGWETGTRGEGQLIGKILLLIRAITHCHNYQCHQRVCNGFLVASRDSRTPSVLHMLPITLPDWIYANWTKIKSHLRGEPLRDSFRSQTHTQTDITVCF